MIRLLCYEPAGTVLALSADDLTRHVLGLGATGSGKTTALINPILQQVIARNAFDARRRAGLLVLDPKEDDTVDRIRTYARKVGRQNDVSVLSNTGDSYYGYFTDLKRLDQVDEFTRRVLYGTREMGDQNAYWTESRYGFVNSALTVLLATGERLGFDRVVAFLRAWLYAPESSDVTASLDFVTRLLRMGNLASATRRRLQLALNEAQNWRELEARTRELHKSAMNNALRSLLSPVAGDLFDELRPNRFNPADVLLGKIMVASINSVAHPQLTALLFKALKRDFYQAVLSRVAITPDRERLCGLVLDEMPLSVMPEDVEALALLRSKGGFVIGCAQGINGLDEALGTRRRNALLANFNSFVYFCARENQTDEHAMVTFGLDENVAPAVTEPVYGSIHLADQTPQPSFRMLCPPGSLARLPQHHAYAKLANGTLTKAPVWLAPSFHEYRPPPVACKTDDLATAISLLRSREDAAVIAHTDAPMLLVHMHRRGRRLRLTPNVVAASWHLCGPQVLRNFLLTKMSRRVEGVEGLPSCWVVGFDCWLRANPIWAPAIARVSVRSGVLWPELDPAWSHWGDGPLTIPEALNMFIYPSLWRPLLRRHLAQLRLDRPDLHPEIETLPQVLREQLDGRKAPSLVGARR